MKNILFIILVLIFSFFSCSDGYNDLQYGPVKMVLYVANEFGCSISIYTINSITGQLTLLNTVDNAPYKSNNIKVDPTGRFVYVIHYDNNLISAYTINSADGSLTKVSGSPFAAGTNPGYIAIHPNGKFLYVSNLSSSRISAFEINNSSGVLSPISGSPFIGYNAVSSVSMHPDGKFLYSTEHGGPVVRWYPVDSITGALTVSLVGDNCSPTGAIPGPMYTEPLGRFVYVVSTGIYLYTVNQSTGVLNPKGKQIDSADSITVDPAGKYAYVANSGAQEISVYNIDSAAGLLTEIAGSTLTTGGFPLSPIVDPTGRFLFVADNGGKIKAYQIKSSSGKLTHLADTGSGIDPISMDIVIIP